MSTRSRFLVKCLWTQILLLSSLWIAAYAEMDYLHYVNMVQDANYVNGSGIRNAVLMRYPCGRIGLWSVNQGEIADVVTRGLILYPCIDTVLNKDNTDWRDGFSGDPSMMTVTYKGGTAAVGSSVDLTVTPNVSIYRYRFASATRFSAIVLLANELGIDASTQWNNNRFARIDDRTIEIQIGNSRMNIYFYIKFSEPFTGYGTIDGSRINDGDSSLSGNDIGGYVTYPTTVKDVVAAVGLSHTSMDKAEDYFNDEFASMDFVGAVTDLKNAWTAALGRLEAECSDEKILKEFYTALYSVYAMIFDAVDQPFYTPYNSTRLLTIGSSDFWQYIDGYARCEWDLARQVYPLLALIDAEVYRDNINTIQAQFNRDGRFHCDWRAFAGTGGGMPGEYLGHEAVLPYLLGVPDGTDGIDYGTLLNSIKTHMAYYTDEFWNYGYNPTDGPMSANQTSRSLEQYASLKGIGIFARLMGDTAAYNQYYPYYRRYKELWKPDVMLMCGKKKDGSWSNTGFFEGDGASYRFMVPQDPYGILDLHGSDNAVNLIDDYMKNRADYNDYQLNYEYLPVFADRADKTQDLVRNHIATFMEDDNFTMYEGLWGGNGLVGQGAFYTGNAGPLAACLLGLWYTHTSGGTYLITAPSLDSYVIHGMKELTVQVDRASSESHHISEIRWDGRPYPCFQLSASALGSGDHTMQIRLVDHPAKLGSIYLSSSDGEVTACTGDLASFLDFTIDPMAASCTAQVFSLIRPDSIMRDGAAFNDWTYNAGRKIATLDPVTRGSYHVSTEGAAEPPGAFNLLSPANRAVGLTTSPVLSWSSSPRALTYTLCIDDDSDFSSPLFNQNVGGLTSWQITDLVHSTTYYWRITAHNALGDTAAANNGLSFTTVAPSQVLEAENMDLKNYIINSNSVASNGNLIKLNASGVTGEAAAAFTGPSGVYDVKIWYFDENDGSCTFRFYLEGEKLDDWIGNQVLGSADPVSGTRTKRTIPAVVITHGDQIKLEAVQNAQEWGRFDCIEITPAVQTSIGTDQDGGEQAGFSLDSNYPNPFNSSTRLVYRLKSDGYVNITVHDLQGRDVSFLEHGFQKAGEHSVVFDGSRLASGIYLTRLTMRSSEGDRPMTRTVKMLMVR